MDLCSSDTTLTFRIEFPAGIPLLNANVKQHWSKSAPVTRDLRRLSWALAKRQKIPHLERARFTFTYYPPDRRRRDTPNVLYLTSKACIDGFVDAGVLTDDADKYVRGLALLPGDEIVRRGQVVADIEEVK